MTHMTPQQQAKHILDSLKNYKPKLGHEFKSHEWLEQRKAQDDVQPSN